MIIESCSCLGSFGHDAAALAGAFSGEKNDAFFEKTDTNALKEFHPARVLRQCDHFSRLALLAASRAMAASGITDRAGIGIILASGYGPTLATYDFLDSLLDYGEAMASPLAFSLTVHNIPAAVV
ncbi:MAG: hypothetical protein LBC10_00945, partial [Deltaproteobacteria bacterium]|nr:hypothetical protein [Deltaproteobacteria bacterium]